MTSTGSVLRRGLLRFGRLAAAIPNANTAGEQPRSNYRVSVDEIESRTGYDLLANVPDAVERLIEGQADKVTVQEVGMDFRPGQAVNQSKSVDDIVDDFYFFRNWLYLNFLLILMYSG